jgi:serine/threonine protein kinase
MSAATQEQDTSDSKSVPCPLDVTAENARSAFAALETPRDRITLLSTLGAGAFGEVKLAELQGKGKLAAKVLKSNNERDTREKFLTEARILAILRHPNIVSLVGVCTCEPPMVMLIELMPHGEFLSFLRKHRPQTLGIGIEMSLSVYELYSAVSQIADAMAFLEAHSVIHRDLAARYACCVFVVNAFPDFQSHLGVIRFDAGMCWLDLSSHCW